MSFKELFVVPHSNPFRLNFSIKKIDHQKIAAFFQKNSSLVNLKNKDGDTPIHSAVKIGLQSIKHILQSKDLQVNIVIELISLKVTRKLQRFLSIMGPM